jgi:lipid II isoglutaminyl synthase (glutamine-hydrolysing)
MTGTQRSRRGPDRLRVVHLFPDLLNVYGDAGNVRTIVIRAQRRGVEVDLQAVESGAASIPAADVLLIGGGQDREQLAVSRELVRLGPAIRARIAEGASLLAVCGGYQNLGWSYRTSSGATIDGPGILDVRTNAGTRRLVGPVVAAVTGLAGLPADRRSLVGFENHAGRTELGPGARALAAVEIGHGNNDRDGMEGILAQPGDDGLLGLRIGTYLHGPLLPRNPQIADALIAAGLGRGGPSIELAPLDDTAEWLAHERYAERSRARRRREERLPPRRIVDPIRSLIGF